MMGPVALSDTKQPMGPEVSSVGKGLADQLNRALGKAPTRSLGQKPGVLIKVTGSVFSSALKGGEDRLNKMFRRLIEDDGSGTADAITTWLSKFVCVPSQSTGRPCIAGYPSAIGTPSDSGGSGGDTAPVNEAGKYNWFVSESAMIPYLYQDFGVRPVACVRAKLKCPIGPIEKPPVIELEPVESAEDLRRVLVLPEIEDSGPHSPTRKKPGR